MMKTQPATQPDPIETLTKAYLNAGKALGLTQEDLGSVIGRDRTLFSRGGLDPETKAGELALLLVRLYRSLFALVGGEAEGLKHWMRTENLHTGGIPREQVKSVSGLVHIVEYLDAMRGRA
jgi:hypothetical protein